MKITNVSVMGLEESLIASGYPMLEKSYSEEEFDTHVLGLAFAQAEEIYCLMTNPHVKRACNLGNTPPMSGHNNFENGIIVQFDVDFTIKAWTEAQRYHFIDFVSSMSTMHKLTKFELDDAYVEYVDKRMIDIMKELQEEYNANQSLENKLRLIYSNPVGMKLTARLTTNYRQLITVYNQRKSHTLPEWKEFCKWVETLPMFKEINGIK